MGGYHRRLAAGMLPVLAESRLPIPVADSLPGLVVGLPGPVVGLPGPVAGLSGGRGGTWQPSSEERSRTVGLISLMVDEYCRGKSQSSTTLHF